jgi:hypothetical protein
VLVDDENESVVAVPDWTRQRSATRPRISPGSYTWEKRSRAEWFARAKVEEEPSIPPSFIG